MGDYWHANPIKYEDYDSLHAIQKKDIKRDKSKKTYLKNHHNIDVLYLWEKDINENIDKCTKLLVEYVNNKGNLKEYNSYNYHLVDNELEIKSNIIIPFFMKANTKHQK